VVVKSNQELTLSSILGLLTVTVLDVDFFLLYLIHSCEWVGEAERGEGEGEAGRGRGREEGGETERRVKRQNKNLIQCVCAIRVDVDSSLQFSKAFYLAENICSKFLLEIEAL
jgi:hypothetical protein